LAESADAVVVGGGILGAAAALHLREHGLDVLLIERDEIAQGTSSAGAGFIDIWGAGYVPSWDGEELEIEQYGLDFYAALAEGDHDLGYRRNGTLFLATNEDAWSTHLDALASHERVPDKRVVSPAEVEELTGIVRGEAILGGVLHPSGGQVSAPKATRAMAERLLAAGGRIRTRCPATKLLEKGDRIRGVETPSDTIETPVVVLACGAWTNRLLAGIGRWLPMVPLLASRLITEGLGVPATMPTIQIPEFSYIWLRGEEGALLWGCDYEVFPHELLVDADVPERLDQLPLDGVVYTQRVGAQASVVIPLLLRYSSITVAHGAPCFTPDRRGLVGPIPGAEGLYVIAGCNEAGVSHAPGWGRLTAELVAEGAGILTEGSSFALDRFESRYATERDVLDHLSAQGGELHGVV
jgi:glycine/D-amino acid oxidase-like deaminating enzyme